MNSRLSCARLLGVEPPPGRVELQERVLDEVPRAHAPIIAAARPLAPRRARRLADGYSWRRADRAGLAVLVDLPGWRHPPHRGARRGAAREPATRRASSRPFDPDDALSRRLHRGARPQRSTGARGLRLARAHRRHPRQRRRLQHGAHAARRLRAAPRAARRRLRRRAHPRAGRAAGRLGRALLAPASCRSSAPSTPTPRTSLTNGIAAVPLGGRRRMNRLHARIAVSEAAAWTARRFYGGRYRIIPNGVHAPSCRVRLTARGRRAETAAAADPVHRPGGRAQGAAGAAARLRGAARARARDAHARRRRARGGRAHDARRPRRATRSARSPRSASSPSSRSADVLCAPSLHGESFGMVLTEAFAAATPVSPPTSPATATSCATGVDGLLVAAGDALALAEALRRLALDPRRRARMALAARERAERFAWPHVAAEVLDTYEQALARRTRRADARSERAARAPRLRARRPAAAHSRRAAAAPARRAGAGAAARRPRAPRRARCAARRSSLSLRSAGLALALLALQRIGVDRVAAIAARLQARPARRRAGADVRGDVRARDRLARDPRRRADLAARQTRATRCRARSSAC